MYISKKVIGAVLAITMFGLGMVFSGAGPALPSPGGCRPCRGSSYVTETEVSLLLAVVGNDDVLQ